MTKPATFNTVVVDDGCLDIPKVVVQEFITSYIEDILFDEYPGYDQVENAVSKIARSIAYIDYDYDLVRDVENIQSELSNIILKVFARALVEYKKELLNILNNNIDLNSEVKLEKILKSFIKKAVKENPNLLGRRDIDEPKTTNKSKEDPCIAELKALAKKLGYKIVRDFDVG